jgi:hypothetical protein
MSEAEGVRLLSRNGKDLTKRFQQGYARRLRAFFTSSPKLNSNRSISQPFKPANRATSR